MSTPIVISIGTSHPWNIAGVGLDARVACEYGVRNASVIVGITAQDETGLHAKFSVPADVVHEQLARLPQTNIGALRIGALFGEENVREVAHYVRAHPEIPAIVDPVFEASLGGVFADEATFAAFRTQMLQLPVILTPNISEAQRLLSRTIDSEEDMASAARALLAMGARAVLLKGGHLSGDPIDVFASANETKIFRNGRLPFSMRGTGCTLAAALACEIAQGKPLIGAVESARAYVRKKIEAQISYASLHVAF